MLEIKIVGIDDQDLVAVRGNPLLIETVQTGKILYADGLLVRTATLLDLADKMRDTALQIDKQVRRLRHRSHGVENLHIGCEIPVRQVPHLVIVSYKDIYALKNSPVLNDDGVTVGNGPEILKPAYQEIHLQIETPALDILIIILEIRILSYRLETRNPTIMLAKHRSKGCLSCANITCDSNMHIY